MKFKNAKVKSIFIFILTLVVIAGVSFVAYKASMNVGKSQQKAQVEETAAKEDEASKQGEEATTEGTAQVEDGQASDEKKTVVNNTIKLGLDLQGGVNIVYEPKIEGTPTADQMSAARTMIQKRLDAKGYTEAEVTLEGTKKIRVDIPGVADPQKAIQEIGAAGMLRFLDQEGKEIVTGKNVTKATANGVQDNGQSKIVVSVEMDKEGTKLFSDFTKNSIGQPIYIMLDETMLSFATIQAHITDGKGMITGNFTAEEAKELADGINAGALPFTLDPVNSSGIGPKLGMDSLRTSLTAGIIGFIIILIFMVAFYRICGIASDIALVLYVGIVILVLSGMGATLTLPGIAGILLSIGMAVDANVIIFARIKEELVVGRSIRAAVDAGFHKAFSAILDGNVTTLIAAGVLYIFGTGLIKSFATTLGIGIIVSLFTALTVTRVILKSFIGMNIKNPALYAAFKKAE